MNIQHKCYKSTMFLTIFLFVIILFLVVNPSKYINSAYNGILIWAKAVLPALFPFFFITRLLTELGGIKILANYLQNFMQKVYHVGGIGGYVFLMSILSGYPVGAKITSELYEKKMISSDEAHRLVTFTSTSGPLFIIGTVGVGMFVSTKMGFIILLAHFLGAIINGLMYRNYKYKKTTFIKCECLSIPYNCDSILEKSMTSAINSILIVGGYIAVFFILIDILIDTNILVGVSYCFEKCLELFSINTDFSTPLFIGFIEMTRGCYELSQLFSTSTLATIVCTFMITFGGLSTMLQAMTFLQKCKIKLSFFFKQKMTHAFISCIIALCLCYIFF